MEQINRYLTISIANLYPKQYKDLTFWLGIVPFELYKSGIFIALIQLIWLSSFNGIQFHVLPFLISSSIINMLKSNYDSIRPGCIDTDTFPDTNPNYCEEPIMYESFPSGHSGIAFSFVAGLYMQLFHGNGKFFEIPIPKGYPRIILFSIVLMMAIMTAIHRIVGGYHSVLDVLFGGALGFTFGVFTWLASNCVTNNTIQISEILNNNSIIMLMFKGLWTIVILNLAYIHLTEDLLFVRQIHHS